MNRDEMIETVAEALDDEADVWQLARMAVETLEQAGAFDVTLLLAQEAGLAESEVGSDDEVWIPKTNWKQRAERAEAELDASHDLLTDAIRGVDQQKQRAEQAEADRHLALASLDLCRHDLLVEHALAARLAEALKEAWTHEMDSEDYEAALADWETHRQ